MFLDRVAQLGYLEPNPESNILTHFPLAVRTVLVKEVAEFLLSSPGASHSLLVSRSHVLWVLETCGQGFRLPIEDSEIIQLVIDLYRQWILEPKRRPTPVEKEFQFFLQIIIKQFSQLFAFRSELVVERHAQLCSSVLGIYQSICRVMMKKLSSETWEVMLKLLVGIADSLFLPTRDGSLLGHKLCNQMLHVLFDCWLQAQTFHAGMWKSLKDRVSKWTLIPQTITQWKAVSHALTDRVINLMYGGSHGCQNVIITLESDKNIMNLDDEYVMYAWHRILTLLNDLNEIQNPGNFLTAFQGVDEMVTLFLKVSDKLPGKVVPPDGNTILHLFGKWLFEAIQSNRKGFEEGTALAIKILSKVFSSRKKTAFLDTYLASFYRCLQEILMGEGLPLTAVILHTKDLLAEGLSGSRILVQYYIYAITRLIVGNATCPPYDVKRVRAACIHILSNIYCYPLFFGESAFKLKLTYKERQVVISNYHIGSLSGNTTPPPKSIFETKDYSELKPHLDFVLLEGLKNETNHSNILSFLQLCFAHSCAYLDHESEFVRNTIHTIVGKAVTPKKWTQPVILAALKTVSRMAFMLPNVPKGKELARKIISPLSGFVQSLCHDLFRIRDESDKPQVRLAVQCFHTLAEWITVDQWLIDSPDRMPNILDAISIGLIGPKQKEDPQERGASKKDKKDKKNKEKEKKGKEEAEKVTPSKKISRAAYYLLRCLLNRVGVFPPAGSGATSVSCLVTEEELVDSIVEKAERLGHSIPDKKQLLRSFLLQDQTIITIVDHPYDEDGPKTTLILRDLTGRYCWHCSSAFLPFNERGVQSRTMEHCRQPVELARAPHNSNAIPLEEERFASIYSFLGQRKCPYNPFDLTKEMCEAERSVLEPKGYQLLDDITSMPPPPADPYLSNCKFQQGRLIMTHLGFLTLENWSRIQHLEHSSSFLNSIRQLDQLPERHCRSISVLYLEKGQTMTTGLSNQAGSLDYQEFVSSLGWGIHTPTHPGFLGGLERSPPIHGEHTMYYSTCSLEVIFHVATLMPNNPQQADQTHKARLITQNPVVIVWTEGKIEDYQPEFGRGNIVHIVIHPVFVHVTHNLYRVRIFVKKVPQNKMISSDVPPVFGPAMNGMLLSKDKLGIIARETAIDACQLISEGSQEKQMEPLEARHRQILEIGRKPKMPDTFESLQTSIFAPLSGTKIVPPIGSGIPLRRDRQAFQESLPKIFAEKKLALKSFNLVKLSNLPSSEEVPPSNSRSKPRTKRTSTPDIESADSDHKSEPPEVPEKKRKRPKGIRKEGRGSLLLPPPPTPAPLSPPPPQEEEPSGPSGEHNTSWAFGPGSERKRPVKESSFSPAKGESGAKISMSSQRMGANSESDIHMVKPPRPQKTNLPQLDDLEDDY